jgi:hypothetical protein
MMSKLHAFRHEPRERLTDQQRAKLFLDKGGKCHRCRRKLRSGENWTAEHVIALQNGGTNADGNWDVTCDWCLPGKNADDAAIAAKGRAVVVSCYVPRRERQKKGRPMPGTKRSGWKRKMSGELVRR